MFSFSLALLLFFALDLFFPSRNQSNHVVVFTMKKKREKRFFFKFLECLSPPKLLPSNPFFGSRIHTHTHISKVEKKITAENDQNSASILYNKNNSTTHSSGISTKRLSPPPPSDLYNFFFDDRTSCVYIFLYSRAKTK